MSAREALRATTMIIKFVRAHRLLPWIMNNYPLIKTIFLLRHPCAVVASQLNSVNWSHASKPDIPDFIKNSPRFVTLVSNTKTVEEYLAVNWALDQLPVFMSRQQNNYITVTYEEIVKSPHITLTRIFEEMNI